MTDRNFVQMAREHVEDAMRHWHDPARVAARAKAPLESRDLELMIDRLVGDQIILLRAIEELQARPWWRR